MGNKGFTLLELLIVIGIIGVLAGVVLVSFPSATKKARLGNAMKFADNIRGSLQQDLVAWWKFDEASGNIAEDSWWDNLDGTITGAIRVDGVDGGRALKFDNIDDGVSIANKNFVGLTSYSMEAWVKPLGAHKHYTGTIISSGDWNVAHWAFGIGQNNNSVDVRRPDGSVTFSIAYDLEINNWHHVVISRNGTNFYTYVNGKKINTRTVGGGALASNASNTTIGRETYASGYFDFNGAIDEVRVYSAALPQSAIEQHYAQGLKTHQNLALTR